MELLFWLIAGLLVYGLVGYGLLVSALALAAPRRTANAAPTAYHVAMIVAARNEAASIGAKIGNARSLPRGPHRLEILVVSDGSTDATADEVRRHVGDDLRLIEIPNHRGKVAALNLGIAATEADILLFSDATSLFAPQSLVAMLRHFDDPEIGGVCGRLRVARAGGGGLGAALGFYLAYDDALKRAESRLAGATAAHGPILAIRRRLIDPLPPAVADDFYLSASVVAKGSRLVFEPAAIAEEPALGSLAGEFRRRRRAAECGWRAIWLLRRLLDPRRYGFYSVQLFSHKLLRRLNPFLLLALLAVNLPLAGETRFYLALLLLQVVGYSLALAAVLVPSLRRLPGMSMLAFVLVGHAAMAAGLIRWLAGHRTEAWEPAR